MKSICFLLVSMLLALVSASAEDKSAERGQAKASIPSQIHLYLDGQWGMDSDIFIYSDDTYVYHTYSEKERKTVRKLAGKTNGLFREVIDLVDRYKMWAVSAASLAQDLKEARKGKGGMGVADACHYHLTISNEGQILKADFYAPDSFSSHYPEAKQLAAFNFVTTFIIRKTEKREH